MAQAVVWLLVVSVALNLIVLVALLVKSSDRQHRLLEDAIRQELRAAREEAAKGAREAREELSGALGKGQADFATVLSNMSQAQRSALDAVATRLEQNTESNSASLERVRRAIDQRVKELQEGNETKLEEMRKTVDEKLHGTLEKRLGESFTLVSDRLEAVQRGLGEMQNLATGVGDLKRVLTNVKARGTWAEIQLGAILEQILAPGQYERNVHTREHSGQSVEYAIRLPGPRNEPSQCVWLPIDSKFPQEDYLRLQDAADRADAEGVQSACEALARTVRTAARDIRDKYLNPPNTTDFAVMYLATEGLYAEVVRQPALVDDLHQHFRVVVAGPTTLAAILNSLRMGFQTVAIEQRATEVWRVLAAVKTEFGKFAEVLDKVKRQLNSATLTIDQTGIRTRAMAKRLRSVEELSETEVSRVLELPARDACPGMLETAPGEVDEMPV